MKKLSIIIPAYNEGKRIVPTLNEYCRHFKDDTEILVIANGCSDDTAEVSRELEKNYSNLKTFATKNLGGKGAAVYYGFKEAQGELVGFVDADGATSAIEFEKLVKQVAEDNDGVIASRYNKNSKIPERSFVRDLASITFRMAVKILFMMPYTDTQCGAKVFKKKLADFLLKKHKVKDMTFDVEMLYLAKKNDYKVIESPTIWVEKGSSAALGSPANLIKKSIKMFLVLFKIKFI
ncbi:MAG: glycosyltransferase [Patescibacteria group bacterium]